jgi:hypothetical protein
MHLDAEIELNSEMNLEAVIEQGGEAFGGRDRVSQR